VRNVLEYAIFALLEHDLRRLRRNLYRDLVEQIFVRQDLDPSMISLN
jgi:hypothetical protein